MHVLHHQPGRVSHAGRRENDTPTAQVAGIYDRAGKEYAVYADGDLSRLFSFDGIHGYADREIWRVLDEKLINLKARGATSIRLLDAGCGPGTWLRRMIARARELGFSSITARGFDISRAQIEQARVFSRDLADSPGANVMFDVADLTQPLPEADGVVDIALCLYSVLGHLPVGALPDVSRELSRVTSGHLVISVRSIGSLPSGFVGPIEAVRYLQHDHDRDLCEIELQDRSRATFSLHLFTAAELRRCFAQDFIVEDVRGLDLFHTRFTPDTRWSPSRWRADKHFCDELAELEELYVTRSEFVDWAMHIMLVASGLSAQRNDVA